MVAPAAGVRSRAGDGQPAGPGAVQDVLVGHRRPGRRSPSPGQQFGISVPARTCTPAPTPTAAIYLPGAVGTTSTVKTEVTSQQNMTGFAKAGHHRPQRHDRVRAPSPEGVILFESPSGGIQLEWDSDGGDYINSVTPPNGTIPESLPVWLRTGRATAPAYTGYYSYDGSDWLTVGTRHRARPGRHAGRRHVRDLARRRVARAGRVQRLQRAPAPRSRRRWPPLRGGGGRRTRSPAAPWWPVLLDLLGRREGRLRRRGRHADVQRRDRAQRRHLPGDHRLLRRLGHRPAGHDQRERRRAADPVVHPDRQLHARSAP